MVKAINPFGTFEEYSGASADRAKQKEWLGYGSKNPEWQKSRSAEKSALKDIRGYGRNLEEYYKALGYREGATPYLYQRDAFTDPYRDQNKEMLARALAARQGVETPTVQGATIDPTQQEQFRNYQLNLANQLQGQATGQTPSLGELQLKQGMSDAMAQQRAFAASQGGVSPALAARQAAIAGGELQGQTNMAAAQTRLAEQLQAQQQLAGLAAQGRESDLGLAGAQANLMQQASLANQQAQLQAQNQLDQMTQYYVTQGLSLDQAQWAANMALEQLRGEQHAQAQKTGADITSAELQSSAAKSQGRSNMTGGILSGLGGIGALFLSDRTKKTKIRKAKDKFYKFLDTLGEYEYDYKDKKYSTRRHFGVMAQDLEKSDVGKSFVHNTEMGKMIDSSMGFGAILAATKNMHDRIKKLEGGK